MSAAFFENFAVITEALDGVAKLRELILQLAVRGRLLRQNEQIEPSLLARIKAEQRRLIKNKEIREPKPLLAIGANEPPYQIPPSWEWARLGEIGQIVGGGTPSTEHPEYFAEDGIPWLTPADLYKLKGKFIGKGKKGISARGLEKSSAQLMPAGTVLFSSRAPIGYVAIALNSLSTNQGFKSCVPFLPEMSEYVYCFLKAIAKQLDAAASGTTFKEVPGKQFRLVLIPLPPLEEQKRIVDKVDELMRLCDELEGRQQSRRESRVRLNNVTLAPLNNAASLAPEEFEQASLRLADNFAGLYDSSASVGKLRSTITQLAVQGKLVPQDPQDEAASALVTRIKRLRGGLSDTKIAKVEQMPPIEAEHMSFPLPDGWRWTRLAEICEVITKGSSPKWQGISYVKEGEGILFVTSENVGSYRMLFDNRKFVDARFNDIEPRSILRRNDLLMNIVGASIGRAAAFDSDEVANINQAVCLIRIAEPALVPYLLHFFNSDLCIQMMFDQQVDNARANLSMGNIAKFPIPVPPLAEQKRIVAEANRLMALCDELEAKLHQAEADSEKLVNAAVQLVLSSTTEPPILTDSSLRPGFSQA